MSQTIWPHEDEATDGAIDTVCRVISGGLVKPEERLTAHEIRKRLQVLFLIINNYGRNPGSTSTSKFDPLPGKVGISRIS